jgi:8-oxo-dGTP diphosphatase
MTATSSPAEPPESTLAAVVEYVVGFAFDTDGRVALIRKNRPEWQAGRLNGIGGHVEATDRTPWGAMCREWCEETGQPTPANWRKFVVMDFPGARIHFFTALGLAPDVANPSRSLHRR